MKTAKSANNLFRRKRHISRVSRILPINSKETVNTVFGEQEIILTKGCAVCQTVQPIGNFYAKAEKCRRGKTAEELTAKDMEWMCISCWDERKPRQRKEKKTQGVVINFFKDANKKNG